MSLTGPLAANGKMSLVAMQVWEADINAQGGLLGRPVKLVYYDDQSKPAEVPAIYSKLLDIDKVDLIVSGYASTQIAAAMPIAIGRNKLFVSLFGTGINDTFKYDKYFAMIPNGPTPKPAFTRGFFKVAEAQNPKPETIALAYADAEFGQNACEGARENAKASGFKIVYDKSYPPATVDFSPIVRAIQARNPDLLVICSYPLDTVGMIKTINEIGFKPKMWGGAMVGLQATAFKTQLGPLLNGVVNFETWLPVKSMEFPGSMELLKKYQERAGAAGTDPLGYYMPVWAYADLQVLGQAIAATKSLNDDVLAAYMHEAHVQHRGRRGEIRADRRMDGGADARRPISEHQGQQRRRLPRHQNGSDRLSAAVQKRRGDLSVPECDSKIEPAPLRQTSPACEGRRHDLQKTAECGRFAALFQNRHCCDVAPLFGRLSPCRRLDWSQPRGLLTKERALNMKSYILAAALAAATFAVPMAAQAQSIPEGIVHGGSVGMNTAGPVGAVVGGALGGVVGGFEGLFGIRPINASYSDGQPHGPYHHGVRHTYRRVHRKPAAT